MFAFAEHARPAMGVAFILVGAALWFGLYHRIDAWLINTLPSLLIGFSVIL